ESSPGHHLFSKRSASSRPFSFLAQEAKRLRALREDSKGCACKRSRGRARVTESSPGHHLISEKVSASWPFFIFSPGSKAPARFA
ncbi:hypothetical protein, partial [Burkholderia ubonensis]|uniref:hypothetical protein n=1 Tax=Burkholderia ubonensis TaxID=101571 RepID=UPI001E620E48